MSVAVDQQFSPHLKGDLTIWLVIALEMATFMLFFVSFAWVRADNIDSFRLHQEALDSSKGLINTALLITGSWAVVRSQSALKKGLTRPASNWLLSAILSGLVFMVFKVYEYKAKFEAGIGLDTDTFYTFYFLLTGFHFFHVFAACIFLLLIWFSLFKGRLQPHHTHSLDTAAAFWHMVDLLWVVLFPLVYLLP